MKGKTVRQIKRILKGEVFAGEIKPDDVAKKGNVSFLVISAAKCDHR
jgi:hypothetical protein